MATVGYYIEEVQPPLMLGKTVINVKVGQQIAISAGSLMNSFFPYSQDQDFPMGDIKITGSSGDYRGALSATNVSGITRVELTNNTSRISRTNATNPIVNDTITYNTHNGGNFKVRGISIGTVEVYYTAKAIHVPTLAQSSTYSTAIGTIEFVVSNPTNQMPSNVQGITINVIHNLLNMVGVQAFLTNYADPENDAAKDVVVTTLPPAGQLMLMGAPITAGQLPITIPVSSISSGALMYFADATTSVGSTYTHTFGVSDVGSGLVKY